MDYGYPYGSGYQQQWQPVPPQHQQMQQRYAMPPQPQQQQTMQAGIPGRMIGSESDLLPSDVTSDGSFSWYPVANGACVIGRRMDKDFNVDTVRYVPEAKQPPQPTQADRIEDKLNRLIGMIAEPQAKGGEDAGEPGADAGRRAR